MNSLLGVGNSTNDEEVLCAVLESIDIIVEHCYYHIQKYV